MTANPPKFRLFHLPRLALENVLSNFDHSERFEFSTCSKRCKEIVKSLRHGRIEIDVLLNHRLPSVTVTSGSTLKKCTWFHLFDEPGRGVHQFLTLNGRTIRMTKIYGNVCIYCSGELTVDTKALVDHLVETFRVPIETLRFDMNDFYDHRDFVRCFPKCDDLIIYRTRPILEEDITYIKENVEYKRFYINRNPQ